jgi:hypothetical protein
MPFISSKVRNTKVQVQLLRTRSTDQAVDGTFELAVVDEGSRELLLEARLNVEQFANLLSTRQAHDCEAKVFEPADDDAEEAPSRAGGKP